jgi:hypothetical protein
MYLNNTVEIFVPVITRNSANQVIKNWQYKQSPIVPCTKQITGDVQPRSLSIAELQQWGISDLTSNAKIMFYDTEPLMAIGNRVRIDSDIIYDIRGTNPWPRHDEALLIPVQGE